MSLTDRVLNLEFTSFKFDSQLATWIICTVPNTNIGEVYTVRYTEMYLCSSHTVCTSTTHRARYFVDTDYKVQSIV